MRTPRAGCALVVVAALWATACAASGAVECADGRVCPAGTTCDDLHGQCVTEAQTTACVDLANADRCSAAGFEGVCDQGVCIAACGDGVRREDEECDDGNYVSHDGCSSGCTVEVATWLRWQSTWTPRALHVAAWLPGEQPTLSTLVVFGGVDEQGPSDTHWELGQDWTERTDLARPPARLRAAMATDEQRRRLVLFGGTTAVITASAPGLDDTWTYDGARWTRLDPPTRPPPRWGATMAYANDGRVVLFGGRDNQLILDDTWEFDGTTWTQIAGAVRPPGRYNGMMVWAPFTGDPHVALFGGNGGSSILADHWTYTTAGGWTQLANMPVQRQLSAAAFMAPSAVAPQGRIIMFGGFVLQSVAQGTWEYAGSAWRDLAPPEIPPLRRGATLVSRAGGQNLTLVGGADDTRTLDDVWGFTEDAGGAWKRRNEPARPPARGEAGLVYETAQQRTVLMGGSRDGGPNSSAFNFEGTGKTWKAGTAMLGNRSRFAVGHDPVRGQTVLFGGLSLGAPTAPRTEIRRGDATPMAYSTKLEPKLEPPDRTNGVMAFHERLGRLVLFGGIDPVAGLPLADTWTFDTAWTQVDVGLPGPAASERPAMAYDPIGERLVLLAEDGVTWARTDGPWQEIIAAPTGPGARTGATMAHSAELAALVLHGGSALDGTGVASDVWLLTGTTWTRLEVAGEPPPVRQDPKLVEHRPLRALLLHGGLSPSGSQYDDTWLLQYRSLVPDERCDNGADDDGDRVVDAADPDCQ